MSIPLLLSWLKARLEMEWLGVNPWDLSYLPDTLAAVKGSCHWLTPQSSAVYIRPTTARVWCQACPSFNFSISFFLSAKWWNCPEQWLSNFSMHKHHLETNLKHRLLDPHLQSFQLSRPGWGRRNEEFPFLTSFCSFWYCWSGDHSLRTTRLDDF
jgi:hypothetical protein